MRKIDYNLKEKLDKQNQTLGADNNPVMSIEIARAKNTVQDSTYWTTEIIRQKAGLGESKVAPRRLSPQGSPDRLYNIYVDNGIVKTAYRDYPDYQELKWQDQFTLGPGTSVAISFDGYWAIHRENWRIVTSEKPWIFWVNSGNLFAQYWDEIDTRIQLASSVVKVEAIRAWRNVNIVAEDQGLVVSYIKNDGKVYYRNYCEQLTSDFYWEPEQHIEQFTQPIDSLNLFITNDYRTGFVGEDSLGKIQVVITERSWAGMAIRPEYIASKIQNVEIDLKPLVYRNLTMPSEKVSSKVGAVDISLLYASQDNEILFATNRSIEIIDDDGVAHQDWGYEIEVDIKNPLGSTIEPSNVTVIDVDRGKTVNIAEIIHLGGNKYSLKIERTLLNGINDIEGSVKIVFTGLVNQINQTYDVFEIEFAPVNLVYPPPKVEVIWNE